MDGFGAGGGYAYDPSGSGGYYDNPSYYDGTNHPPAPGYYPDPAYNSYGGPESMDPSYYPQHQEYGYPNVDAYGAVPTTAAAQDGSFYFHGEISPRIYGFPVNALAFDTSHQALFVASVTQSVSSTRWRSHRASMLVTHNTEDGMLYSSVAGHPEASPSTLQAVYECMFGISKTIPMPPGRQHIPPHAYRAHFGSSEIDTSVNMMGSKHGHIGISSILPLGSYAGTISPSAVRIHSH